jgi:hypothetical protein
MYTGNLALGVHSRRLVVWLLLVSWSCVLNWDVVVFVLGQSLGVGPWWGVVVRVYFSPLVAVVADV